MSRLVGGVAAVAMSIGIGATGSASRVPTGKLLVVAEPTHESGGVNYASDVYVVGVDGRHLRNLTHDHASNVWAQWTPDAKRVIFASHRSNTEQGPWHIHVINADGSGRRRLTSATGGAKPALSPDGRRIAFVVERPPDRAVYVMNADGRGRRLLTRQHDERGAVYEELGTPGWSADGQWILFTHRRWGGASPAPTSLYVMQADGSRLTRVEHSLSLGDASWAPRGDTLLVAHKADFTIAHVRPRGDRLGLVRVRKIKSRGGYFVDWSPDARSILFSVSGRLWVADVDGRESRRGPVNAFSMAWSPDGRWIAFARSRASNPIEATGATGRDHSIITRRICCLLDEIAWAPR